jgi:hypothetical protein
LSMHGLLAGMALHCTKGDSLESHGQPPSLSSGSHRPPTRHLPSGPSQLLRNRSIGQGRHVVSSSLSPSAKVETKGFSIVRKVSAARRRRRRGTTRRRERFGKRTVETDTYSQLEIFAASSRDLKSRKFLRKLQSLTLEAGINLVCTRRVLHFDRLQGKRR